MTKKKYILITSLVAVAAVLSLLGFSSPHAHALSDDNWSRYLIDDSIFRNNTSMNASQIQSFLGAQGSGLANLTDVENCGSTSDPTYSYEAQYYSCGQTEPDSKIIYDAGQAYGINPQVILATLQKEQSLVTTPNPTASQLNYAMGYGCPDSGGCSFPGFFTQVDNATWQLRFNYERANGDNTWWNSNLNYACNSSTNFYSGALVPGSHVTWFDGNGVNYNNFILPNASTSSLYCYTPHVYNNPQGLYGLPQYGCCGDYYSGSYNFVDSFVSWWGSTYAPSYQTTFYNFSGYPYIKDGATGTVWIEYQNTGTDPLYDQTSAPGGTAPLVLATTNPINNPSPFYDSSTWTNNTRPTTGFAAVYNSDGTTLASNQHVAQPGQIIKFSFDFSVPNNTAVGTYTQWLQPALEGASNWNTGGIGYFYIGVLSTYAASYYNMSGYPSAQAGSSTSEWIEYQNTGNTTWNNLTAASGGTYVDLETTPQGRSSPFSAAWTSTSIPSTGFAAVYNSDGSTLASNQNQVAPTQIVKFNLTFTIPVWASPGTYQEWVQPVVENNVNPLMGGNGFFNVTVQPTTYSAQFTKMQNYPNLMPGSQSTEWIQYQNTGNATWYDSTSAPTGVDPVTLATLGPNNRPSDFSWTWPSPGTLANTFGAVYNSDDSTLSSNQHEVLPGQYVQFNITWTAGTNENPGTYQEWFAPYFPSWPGVMTGGNGFSNVTVQQDSRSMSFYNFSGYPSVAPGSSSTVTIEYKNTGNDTLYDQTSSPPGVAPLVMAMTNPINNPSPFYDSSTWTDNNRPTTGFAAVYQSDGATLTSNQHQVQPGQIVKFSFDFKVPSGTSAGTYQEWLQPILEGASNWNIGGLGYFNVIVN
ncbi:MAG TPA: hypothetical protein VGS28_01885 [Candidatus Saccharimonadales bacterium]|nr:hypothetical protein [Candidatus Saccharimonadales bacterium]